MRPPGGGPSAYHDTFARSLLPPPELWPHFDYSAPHLSHYPDRMNAAVTLLDSAVAEGHGDRPVFHYEGTTWTFRHLLDRVERIARVLVEDYGLRSGERVLLRSGNTPMLAACWLAVMRVGGIVVNTMALLRARELVYILDKVQIRLALCEASLMDDMEAARAQVPELKRVSYFSPMGDGRVAAATLDREADGKPAGGGTVITTADDIALICFTSGTTGNPKAAAHFHRDLLACCDCWPRVFKVGPDEVTCGSPSMAFTYGLAAFLLYPLRYRASAALVGRPNPDDILRTIEQHRATALYSVPTAFLAMLPQLKSSNISSLRKSTSAGEHLRLKLWEDWRDATGLRLVNALGSTEMVSHFVSESEAVAKVGSTGLAVPGFTACILDDQGNPLPPRERGRLAVRGPTGCRYLGDIDRQKIGVQFGWTMSGDLFEQDEDGYFWYVDRSDDMIVSSGYNISAQEVERVVLDHPKVLECAVIGVPDEARGKLVRACVVLRDPRDDSPATAREIQDYVKATIAPYKYPREVKFLDELPKTLTGKIQRYRLRDG